LKKETFLLNKTFNSAIFRTVLKRNWWWSAIFVVIMFSLAFFYLRYTKPLYQSNLVIQLVSEDNAKTVLDLKGFGGGNSGYFNQIELMRSQLLFEEALKTINLNVSIFTRGEFLIEENYYPKLFDVNVLAIKDSTVIGNEIDISLNNSLINLSYKHKGKKRDVSGTIGHLIKSPEFDIIISTSDLNNFKGRLENKNVYFIFNSSTSLIGRLLPTLKVEALDGQAQTVRLQVTGHNPYLCKDLVSAVGNTFIGFNNLNTKKGSENILKFIDDQLDSLSKDLKNSEDSIFYFQEKENLTDPNVLSESLRKDYEKLEDELDKIDDEIVVIKMVVNKVRNLAASDKLYQVLPELMGKSYQNPLAGHIENLNLLLEQKADLMVKVKPENAEIQRINEKI